MGEMKRGWFMWFSCLYCNGRRCFLFKNLEFATCEYSCGGLQVLDTYSLFFLRSLPNNTMAVSMLGETKSTGDHSFCEHNFLYQTAGGLGWLSFYLQYSLLAGFEWWYCSGNGSVFQGFGIYSRGVVCSSF